MMNHEFDAISRLFQKRAPFQHPLTRVNNGDDASVHHIPSGSEVVISTDSSVCGVHWPEDMALSIAGHRAVNAALSDLAAMGAKPAWLWLAVMAKNEQCLSQMSNGLMEACLSHNIELAGGDTSRSTTNAITVTVAGLVSKNKSMMRNSAKEGENIWVIGDLGLSAAGLKQWLSGNKKGSFVANFTKITPLYTKGAALCALGVSCCMDISDGLLQDATHIAKASQVGLNIEISDIEALANYSQLVPHFGEEETLKLMLSGGEDYTLLFTAPARLHKHLLALGAQPIGYCVKGHEVRLYNQGKCIDYNIKGFDHFA